MKKFLRKLVGILNGWGKYRPVSELETYCRITPGDIFKALYMLPIFLIKNIIIFPFLFTAKWLNKSE